MAAKYRNTDYMYASARIRALETALIGEEQLARLCEASSSQEILSLLSEGDSAPNLTGEVLIRNRLRRGYAELDKMGAAETVAFLRYPYDCNNLKLLIKCFAKGIDPEAMLSDGLGSCPLSVLKEAFADKKYDALPAHMAAAAPEAERTFSESGNPQAVDLTLDRACFADMAEAAKNSGMAYAIRLVEARIDLVNLLTTLRLCRMDLRAAGEPILRDALLVGGALDHALLVETLSGGKELLRERLAYTPYSSIASCLEGDAPLGTIERACDNFRMELAKEAKFVPFGAELMIGYAMALEYEAMNLRILLAGKDASLPTDVIRERLRKSYV